MARPVDAQREGAGADDPWLALLLGCLSWSRSLGQSTGTGAAPGEAGSPTRPEPALLALLGVVALDRRLRDLLLAIDSPAEDEPARSAGPRSGLLR